MRLLIAVVAAALLTTVTAHAQAPADPGALVRDLKSPDYDTAHAAMSAIANMPQPRPALVAGLLDALRTGDWQRCGGDMRDAIARKLDDWRVKAAVAPLLEVVKAGKSIEHECVE